MKKENIKQAHKDYNHVFEAIKALLEKDKPLIIAIDGRCGSGKSTLAGLLAEQFDCNVFHMDDFFLPFEMKTKKRLAEPGGNVHYERFKEEVLRALESRQSVIYRPFLCNERDFGEPRKVEPKHLTIVEGSYSLHPTLKHAYDYKIFLTINPKVQHERILERNGEEKLQDFVNKWIPMEEHYFSELNIKNQCDLIIDTTEI